MVNKVDYNEEPLHLSKAEILSITNEVRKYWKRSPLKNAKRLTSLALFEGGIRITNQQDLEDIFKIMLKFIDELRYQNYLIGTKNKHEALLKTVKKSIAEEIFS